MATIIEIKGAAALKRVKQKIGTLGELTKLIHGKDPKGDVTSCALTASVLADVIDPAFFFKTTSVPVHMTVQQKPVVAKKSGGSGGFGGMMDGLKGNTDVVEPVSLTQPARIQKIAELLDQPKLVSITLSPDHYFVAFPISDAQVILLQGFQDAYTLLDWMASESNYHMPKKGFLDALRMLVEGGEHAREASAKALFAFDAGSFTAVTNWFNRDTVVSVVAHKPL